MKRLLLSLAFLLAAIPAHSQSQNFPGNTTTIVTSNPATCSPGQSFFNTTTGLLLFCSATNTLSTTSNSQNGTLASQYGVTGYGKVCFDATLTNASAVINSAGQCAWTQADVGSIGWATSVCNTVICGFGVYQSSITIMPSTQVKVFRIASVQSATQITVDCTAPGNCASPNPSALGTAGHVTIFWAPDGAGTDTTALNAAWAASFPANGCGDLELPTGLIPFNSALFTALPAGQNCTSQALSLFTINQAIGPNNVGPGIHGRGAGSTILVPRPDFNWTSCSAVPSTAIGGFYGIDIENLAVSSFGQSFLLAGLSATCSSLYYSEGGFAHNVNFVSWANSTNVVADGWNIGGNIGYELVSDSNVDAFGGGTGAVCHATGDNDQIVNTVCIAGGGVNSFKNSATILQTANMQFGPPDRNNTPAIVNDVSTLWQDVAGRCEGSGAGWGQTVGSNVIQNAGTVFFTNFANGCSQIGTSTGINNSGTMSLVQYKPYGGITWTTGINNSGALTDGTANGWGGPITNTGTWLDSGSIKQALTNTSVATRLTTLGVTTLIPANTMPGGVPIEITLYAYDSAAGTSCTTSTTVLWTINYTDPTGTAQTSTATETIASNSGNGGATGGDALKQVFPITTNANTAVTYQTTYTIGANCAPGPSYAAQFSVR